MSFSPYDLPNLVFNLSKILPASSTEMLPLPSTSINWKIFSIDPELTDAPDWVFEPDACENEAPLLTEPVWTEP